MKTIVLCELGNVTLQSSFFFYKTAMLTQKTSERRKLPGPFSIAIYTLYIWWQNERESLKVLLLQCRISLSHGLMMQLVIQRIWYHLPYSLSFFNNSNDNYHISRKMYYQAILFYVNVAYVAFSQIAFILIPIIDLLFSIVLLWLFAVWEK